MKIQFNWTVKSPDYVYHKDQIIEASERPMDQIQRWIARGVVTALEEVVIEQSPIRSTVVSVNPKSVRKAVTKQ